MKKRAALRTFGKEHPLISRVAIGGAIGCLIAGLGVVDATYRFVEETQAANPTYPLPTSYCESPPATIEGIFSDRGTAPLGGLGIKGSVASPVDGVRIRLHRTLSKETQAMFPFLSVERPFESEMLPADRSFDLRVTLNDSDTEILGITAIVATTAGENDMPAGCENPPKITSVWQESDVTKMTGNHVNPNLSSILMGDI